MGQHKKNTGREHMPLEQQLQLNANDIVKYARTIVDNRLATWMMLEMPDGSQPMALVFLADAWRTDNSHKLILKFGEKKDESKTTITDGLELQRDDPTGLPDEQTDKPTQAMGE